MRRLIFILLILAIALPCCAATRTVGSGKTYATITAAITASSNGDTIEVYAGTYDAETMAAGDTNKYLYITGKTDLTLTAMGAVIVKAGHDTTIRVIRVANGANNTTFNCATGGSWAVDAWLDDGTTARAKAVEVNATVTGLSITGMTIEGGTAGLDLGTGSATITDCTFTNASTDLGAPDSLVVVGANTAVFTDCSWANGTTNVSYLIRSTADTGSVTIRDCTFTGVAGGRMISCEGSAPMVVDSNTITVTGASSAYVFQAATADKTGAITIRDNVINSAYATATAMIYIGSTTTNGSHAVRITGNTITNTATDQLNEIITVLNQPRPIISNNIVDTLSTTSGLCPIRLSATGAYDASGAQITGNTLRCRHSGGYTIMVGGDGYHANYADRCHGARLEHNSVYGPVYYGTAATASVSLHGPMIGWSRYGLIANNYVNGVGYGSIIKGGSEAAQDWGGAVAIRNNVAVNCQYNGCLVKGASNVGIEYNTIYNRYDKTAPDGNFKAIRVTKNDTAGAGQHATGARIRRNILMVGGDAARFISIDDADQTGAVCTENCYRGTGVWFDGTSSYATLALWKAAGFDTGSLFADPRFINTSAGDFRLRTSSPCIQPDVSGMTRRSDLLYRPQYAWGAYPPYLESLRP